MSIQKAILIGFGTMALLGIVLIGLVVGWIIYASQDVRGIRVSIDSPLDVKVGETFQMTVHVTNERERKVLTVSDIDIADEYLAGFVIVSTEPATKSTMHVPFDNSLSHTFDKPVAVGTTEPFVFTLRAERPGIFRGDVDVCEGSRFITAMAQTAVKD